MTDILRDFVATLAEPPEPPAPEEPKHIFGLQRALSECDPPDLARVRGQSISQARQVIADAMREYALIEHPEHILLIPAPPGTGKTWAGVDFAHWQFERTNRRVFYAGPRHDFFADILGAAQGQAHETGQWYEWLSRKTDDENALNHTCNHADNINTWMRRGYKGMDFCSKVCGWDYVNKGCPYHKQKQRPEPLIFGQHAHVTLGHPMSQEFSIIIGDENPMGTFIKETRIPSKWILFPNAPYDEPLTEILNEMRRLCDNGTRLHGPDLMKMIGPQRIIDACQRFVMPIGAAVMTPSIREAGEAENVPWNYLPEFVPMLEMEAMATAAEVEFLHRIYLSETGLEFLSRQYVNEQMPEHIIWFDATGKADLYEALFGRPVQVADVRPELTGRIFQVVDRANGKSSLIDQNKEQTHRVSQLKAQVDHITRNYQNPGIITFQALTEEFTEQTSHFYGNRGTNAFEKCDVLIVAGTPQPPLFQIEKLAKSIWRKRMRPFDPTWYAQPRRFMYEDNGQGYAYPVSMYADPELNAVLWQYREAELIQAAHRARILFRDVPVYLLTNIPIDELPPFKLLTIRDLMDAPEGVDVFGWERVVKFIESREFVITNDLTDELGINRDTAKKYMQIFVDSRGWEWTEGIRRKGARGPTPRAIRK